MIRFDSDHQRWVDHEAEVLRAQRHTESARQQRQVLKGTFAVLAVCGLAFGTWALGWKDEPAPLPESRPEATPTISQAPSSPPAEDSSTDTDDEPVASESGAPPGYSVKEDPEGFQVAVPDGWDRRTEGREVGSKVVFYEEPGRSRQLQIFWVEDADPYASLELAEKNAEKNKDYERNALDQLDSGDGSSAARLEYTYDSDEHGGTRHVIDHRFEAEDGELYAIVAYGQTEGGTAEQEKELLDTALTYFCPSGAECADVASDSP